MLSSRMMSAPASAPVRPAPACRLDLDFQIRIFLARRRTAAAMALGDSFLNAIRWLSLMSTRSKRPSDDFSAAARDGVFLKSPPAGVVCACRGFARCAFDGIHELRGQSGNAGEPLDEIQRHPLGAQNRARRPERFSKMSPPLTGWPSFTSRLILISPSEAEFHDALVCSEIFRARRARPSMDEGKDPRNAASAKSRRPRPAVRAPASPRAVTVSGTWPAS